MRFALLAAVLALPALAEDQAIEVYERAVKNMNASEGFHLESTIDVDMGGSSMEGGKVEGVVRNPDFAHFKVDIASASLDLYKEGEKIAFLNPQTGVWEGETSNKTLDFFVRIFNLGHLLEQLAGAAKGAELGKTETIGKRECRVVSFAVPKKELEKLMEGAADGGSSLGVSPENAKMKVKMWVDRKDELPRKIQIVIDVEMKGLPGAGEEGEDWEDWEEDEEENGGKEPANEEGEEEGDEEEVPAMKISITVSASIKNYGEKLDVEVPADARKVLDAQKTEKSGGKKEKDDEEEDE